MSPSYLAPLLGSISFGSPREAVRDAEDFVDVPSHIACDFYMRCKGGSMSPLIKDGSMVDIRIQPDVESGQIVAIETDDHETTLKRVRKVGTIMMLLPENPDFDPIIYAGETLSHLHIIGLAVGCTSLL